VLEKMFGKGNLDAADELVHPEFVNHEAPPPRQPRGTRGPQGDGGVAPRPLGADEIRGRG
jgi:hypothetical protein